MAGETGQTRPVIHPDAYYIDSDDRPRAKGKSAVYRRLEESPGSFAFVQAVDIVERYLKSHGRQNPEEGIRFRVNPNLSFPPGDIESLHFVQDNDGGRSAMLTLNLMGLHGASSPLPAYFTEHVAQQQDEKDALRDFFDIFNHRLISILHRIWKKYRYYLQYDNAEDPLSCRFFGFIGMGYTELRQAKSLNWARLLAYTGLIAFKGDAAGSLESTLRHYFSHPDVSIVPCIKRNVPIPPDQQCRLGEGNSTLGADCLIGERVPDRTGKFRISIADLTWDKFTSFLPDTAIFGELTTLVRSVLRSRLQFDLELRLRPSEIKPTTLGEGSVNRLGWSSWLGDGGDGIVLLEPA